MRVFFMHKIQKLIEMLEQKSNCRKKVYMFHSISNYSHNYEEYTISPVGFEDFIKNIKEKGYVFENVNDFLNSKRRGALLTFDDAFEEIYFEAYPILKRMNIPYVVFQSYNLINTKGYLKDIQISEMLVSSRMELGSHLVNHYNLSRINNEQSHFELYESKRRLEEKYNISVKYVAFPFGGLADFKLRDIYNAFACGYEVIFTTISIGYRGFFKNIVPRINVNESNWMKVI